ncbi:MAG: hypothetical protein HY226_03510 [Candidatus Vogelbacteria bacterium]|nr:hypothetical protein [Candidatus Vogelbacteria bacterium]
MKEQKTSMTKWVVVIVLVIIGLMWLSGTSTSPSQPSVVPIATTNDVIVPAVPVVALKTSSDANLGDFLIADNDMTLYYFIKDKPGVSKCSGQCAANWPPYIVTKNVSVVGATGISGKIGTTTREDGGTQLTYNGMPLYFWYKDLKVGDVNGQNIGGTWFVVKP